MVLLTQSVYTVAAQFVTQQPRPAQPPAVPQDLGKQIENAVEQAVQGALDAAAAARSGVEASEARELARDRAREAFENLKIRIQDARAGAAPEVVQIPVSPDHMIPPQAVDMAIAFFVTIAFIAVGLPIARAFARRMDRRSAPAPADLAPRLDRIEQAIEAVAIEVERVSENQRYTTKVMQELRGLPASQPAGWPANNARQAEPVPRTGEPHRP